jgi:signal transduction histidine kinase
MISIRQRLTRELVVIFAILAGIAFAILGAVVWLTLVDSFDVALRSRSQAIAALTEIEGGHVAFDFSADFLKSYSSAHPRHYFQLWDAAGTSLVRSPSLGSTDLPQHTAGSATRPKYWNLTLPNGRAGRATAFNFTPTTADALPAPPASSRLLLVAASDRSDLNETLAGIGAGILGCAIAVAGAVFIVVPRVLRRGLTPLEQLGTDASRIDATSLQTRFGTDRLPSELQPIAVRLNDLLARLERSFERERRFSADLAHELRTPLAELRTLTECALKWPESRDPATDRETLAITEQMEALVGHILALARSEQGEAPVNLRSIALESFVPDVWRSYALRAAAGGVRVELALVPAATSADPALLRAVLANLFDNAVDYTPTGGELKIALEHDSDLVRLSIANTTSDLAADDVPKLFDRFWRKEASRSGGKHIGLGLSLAQTFARAMGWSLTARLENRQLIFTLTAPVSVASTGVPVVKAPDVRTP